MRRNGVWAGVVLVLVVLVVLATDTVSVRCDSRELDVPEAIEDAAENVQDAAEELAGE